MSDTQQKPAHEVYLRSWHGTLMYEGEVYNELFKAPDGAYALCKTAHQPTAADVIVSANTLLTIIPDASPARAPVSELDTLRARVAELEAALKTVPTIAAELVSVVEQDVDDYYGQVKEGHPLFAVRKRREELWAEIDALAALADPPPADGGE